jgi:hypothetical protein
MRDSKYGHFWAGALVALIAVLLTHALDANSAKRSASQVLLSPEDYIEIQQLYSMYARDVDPGSVRDASWMFTNDAVVNMAGVKPMTTPDQIKAFYIGVDPGSFSPSERRIT